MVQPLRQINLQLSSAGQPAADDLQQLATAGFKSVLNLRTPGEATFLANEQQQAEAVGLVYGHVPLSSQQSDAQQVNEAIKLVQDLPKPVLIHCASGARATAIALLAIASEQSWTATQLGQEAEKLGLSLEQPHLQSFLQKQPAGLDSVTDENSP